MGYPPTQTWDGVPPPIKVWTDKQTENSTFPHPSDAGGSKMQDVNLSQDGNPFVQSMGEVDLLVKYPTPPVSQLSMKTRSGSMARQAAHIHPSVPLFEDIYR